jgi:alpha-galactosidase
MIRAALLFPLAALLFFAGDLAWHPPMGWSSWNHFGRNIDDATVRGIADAMVSSGMKDAGYVYVNIDGSWQGARDASGNLQPNGKFPDMPGLVAYIHSLGLKAGIYSSPAPLTCGGDPGSYGYEKQDAQAYAAWGFDYLKYDWCGAGKYYPPGSMPTVYANMGQLLQATGRPLVYDICSYGWDQAWTWGASAGGNMWRIAPDIRDNWQSMSTIGFHTELGLAQFAGHGHWNDPDSLEVGNGGMTALEYQTHMSIWAILAAPLIAGNDIRSMDMETAAILLNKEVIAIDQDKLGKQGHRIYKNGGAEVWAKPLAGGGWAVGLFNRDASAQRVTVTWGSLGLSGSHHVRDLWAKVDIGFVSDHFSADVPSHGVAMIRVRK